MTPADKAAIIRSLLRDGINTLEANFVINGTRHPWLNDLLLPEIVQKMPSTLRAVMPMIAAEAVTGIDAKIVTLTSELEELRALRRQLT